MLSKKLWVSALSLTLPFTTLAQDEEGSGDTGDDLYTKDLSSCPGYVATNQRGSDSAFIVDLSLAGEACNVFGDDLHDLRLEVEYQTSDRLHVKIYDADKEVYQIPDDVFPRPGHGQWCAPHDSKLNFYYQADPFEFQVSRSDTGEILFDTTGNKIVFETQYLYIKTNLPQSPHLYGLGEHSDPFMLNTTNYTRTLWTRDSYGIPAGENLYGAHPIYFDHRLSGTHGVFLLNSNGMDVYIDDTDGQYLEYNVIGGVLDFYFLAGPGPREVAMQYAEITQLPLMTPYWGLGFHQCKYGYRDVYQVAAVVGNYSANDIPLETMWTDIDYMELRRTFTLDPERFPPELLHDLVDTLHARDQHYIVMVDPAIWSAGPNYARDSGIEAGAFIQDTNGSIYEGVVWPGPTYFPDWFNPVTQGWWDDNFLHFFDGETGPDIDALWIDMNEPANFCNRPYPCENPSRFAEENDNPPDPPAVRDGPDALIPGFPESLQGDLTDSNTTTKLKTRQAHHSPPTHSYHHGNHKGGRWNHHASWGQGRPDSPGNSWQNNKQSGSGCGPNECRGLPGREYILPPYMIQNGAGPTLAESTADTDLVHSNGLVEYDVHNLYGSMMSTASKNSMLARRPDVRPFVITRSTFAGAGRDVSHWLGDNVSGWQWYRNSITQILQFASLYQVPVVGPDVCGFGGNVTETLCARWATLGSFYTFFRNHAEISSIYQEFYRWPLTASAARNGISIRYKLLDYIYTAIYQQNQTGTPCLNPLFFNYPHDTNTFAIDLQFFYGDFILISPVVEENSTAVQFYLPDDIFYSFDSGAAVRGEGAYVEAEVPLDEILVHYRGGSIVPQRVESANTTTALRQKGFNVVVALGLDGTAKGSLYLDDGESLDQAAVSEIDLSYQDGVFKMQGLFGYEAGVGVEVITVLGLGEQPAEMIEGAEWDAGNGVMVVQVDVPLTGEMEIKLF